MEPLFHLGAIWAVGAAVIGLVSVVLVPPRNIRQVETALTLALGWPWFVGNLIWTATRGARR